MSASTVCVQWPPRWSSQQVLIYRQDERSGKMSGRQRGHASAQVNTGVCVCTGEPGGVCMFLHHRPALSAGTGEEDLTIKIHISCELCVRVLLKTVPCLWQCVWPAVSVSSALTKDGCIHVLIWDMCSALLLFELVNMKAACAFLKLSRGPEFPWHLSGLQELGGGQSEHPITVWISKWHNVEVFLFWRLNTVLVELLIWIQ